MRQLLSTRYALTAIPWCLFLLFVLNAAFSCKKVAPSNINRTQTLTLQPAMEAGHNVSVYDLVVFAEDPESTYVSPAPSKNFNGNAVITVDNYGFESFLAADIFIRFDSVAALPAFAKVTNATLYLYSIDSTTTNITINGLTTFFGSPGNTIGGNAGSGVLVQRLTSAWDDNSVCWNTMPTATDTGSVTIPVSTTRWNNNVTEDVTDMVKIWQANPSLNFGCRVVYASAVGAPQPFAGSFEQMQFYSSFATDSAVRPKLVITYKE